MTRQRKRKIADWFAVCVAIAMIVGVAAATINWRTATTVAMTTAPTNSK
jgi:hypothetical protein